MRISSVELRSGWLAALVAIITLSAGTSLTQAQSTGGDATRAGSEWPAPGIPADGTVWDAVDATAWAVQPPPDDGAPPAPSERANNCCPLGGWTQSLGFNPVWTGNVFSTNQPRILKEIQLEAGFNGPLAITFGIYGEKPNAPIGDYRALCIKKVTLTGNGRGFYSSGPLNGGAGIVLTPKEVNGSPVSTFFAVAVGWSNASIDFRIDDESYASGIGFCGGTVRGFWARLGTNPPPPACPSTHELIGLQFYDDGAISMKLCFQEPGGACCLGDRSCVDDVTSNACEQELGGEFLGLYSLCALDADSNCGGFGACCPDGGGACVITTQAACEDEQGPYNGVYKGDGSACSAGGANACDQVLGACCRYDGACAEINEYDCEQSPLNDTPGIYQGDFADCLLPGGAPRCEALGACCSIANPNTCTDVAEEDCAIYDCVNTTGFGICPAGYMLDTNGPTAHCPAIGARRCFKNVRTYSPGQPCAQGACFDSVGACCLLGECTVTNELECISLGGAFTDTGTDGWQACDVVSCPAPTEGACCLPNGNCKLLSNSECLSTNGVYQGDGLACSDFICADGACCYENMGSPGCVEVRPLVCAQTYHGEFHGGGTMCPIDFEECFPQGACCYPNGDCRMQSANACSVGGGSFAGEGVVCEDAECPQPGACCFGDGTCRQLTGVDCVDSNGTYNGDNTSCSGVTCTPTAACCYTLFSQRNCQVLSQAQCAGLSQSVWGTPGSTCVPNACDVGACCDFDGTCTNGLRANCEATDYGLFQGAGSDCATATCTPRGACCWPEAQGGYSCSVRLEADCTSNGGIYNGDGVECGVNTCATVPCCEQGVGCVDRLPSDCQSPHYGRLGDLCSDANFCGSGACCADVGTPTCFPTIQWGDCLRDGGDFKGVGGACTPGICSDSYGACCEMDGSCTSRLQSACMAIAGAVFHADTFCADAGCTSSAGACCDLDGSCMDLQPGDCTAIPGRTFQTGLTCASATCSDQCGLIENSDYDADTDVDLRDFAFFQQCFASPSPSNACRCAFDSDNDGDIDLVDLAAFIADVTGLPDVSCAPYNQYQTGDYDNDGHVTLKDFAWLQWCFAPGGDVQCRCIFDLNHNALVDTNDVNAWTVAMTGP